MLFCPIFTAYLFVFVFSYHQTDSGMILMKQQQQRTKIDALQRTRIKLNFWTNWRDVSLLDDDLYTDNILYNDDINKKI